MSAGAPLPHPCPFCNGVDGAAFRGDNAVWWWCESCHAEGPPADTLREAIEAWNRRKGGLAWDALRNLAVAAKPVADRLWETGGNQPAEVIRLGERTKVAFQLLEEAES